jgi:hypothetical protein
MVGRQRVVCNSPTKLNMRFVVTGDLSLRYTQGAPYRSICEIKDRTNIDLEGDQVSRVTRTDCGAPQELAVLGPSSSLAQCRV